MFCRSEGSSQSSYRRGLTARPLSSSVMSIGQVHETSAKDQEDLRVDVLTGDGVEAINLNTTIED